MDIEEENENSIIKDSILILCNKCLLNGEYLIPIFYLNGSKNIEYGCSKNHIISEKDISKTKLTEKLKKSLNECTEKEHIEYYQGKTKNFCAWCEKCSKNICQVDLGIDLKRNHDYLLFMEIMPDFQYEIFVKQKIKKLKDLLDEYNKICPDAEEEINYLNKTYERNLMNFDLYYEKKIINYQTINNILFNSRDDFDESSFELYENILKIKSYKFLYNEFLNEKKINDINKTEINIQLKLSDEMAIFNKDDNIYFAFFNSLDKNLKIYDNNGNTLNEITFLLFDHASLMTYNNNILLIYDHFKIFIIFFSEDYKSYKLLSLFLKYNMGQNQNILDLENLILPFSSNIGKKLIKTSLNNYFFLTKGRAYKIELEQYFVQEISQSINVDAKLISSKADFILKANSTFYKNNNDILEGIIYIHRINDQNLLSIYKIIILNEKLEIFSEIKFKYLTKNKYELDKDKVFNINYNLLNDMILVFINSEIYQINFNTKQVVTIYDITKFLSRNLYNLPFFNSIFFYNYNDKNKKLEEIIIIMDKISNNIYKFYWKEKCLSLEKTFNLPKVQDIIPIFKRNIILDLNKKTKYKKNEVKKSNEETLIIISDNLMIFS